MDSHEPVPLRRGKDWTTEARLQAANQLKARLGEQASVVGVAEAGADYVRELLNARTVTIIALKHGKYFDLVNVGYIPRGNHRYPSSRGYPTWEYPLATKKLAVSGGYFTTDPQDPHFEEYVRVWDDPDVTSIMGVGIVSDGQLSGEIFHTRDSTQPPFDQNDVDLVRDLSTPFAAALVVAMGRSTTPEARNRAD